MRAFFDSNILLYAEDPSDPSKQDVARQLLKPPEGSDWVISTQVLIEFYNVATRKRFCSPSRAREICDLWSECEVVGTDAFLVLRAIDLQQRLKVAFFDALIVQAALDAHCEVLYTEDLQHGQQVGSLKIIDPFREGVHAVHEPMPRYSARKAIRRSR